MSIIVSQANLQSAVFESREGNMNGKATLNMSQRAQMSNGKKSRMSIERDTALESKLSQQSVSSAKSSSVYDKEESKFLCQIPQVSNKIDAEPNVESTTIQRSISKDSVASRRSKSASLCVETNCNLDAPDSKSDINSFYNSPLRRSNNTTPIYHTPTSLSPLTILERRSLSRSNSENKFIDEKEASPLPRLTVVTQFHDPPKLKKDKLIDEELRKSIGESVAEGQSKVNDKNPKVISKSSSGKYFNFLSIVCDIPNTDKKEKQHSPNEAGDSVVYSNALLSNREEVPSELTLNDPSAIKEVQRFTDENQSVINQDKAAIIESIDTPVDVEISDSDLVADVRRSRVKSNSSIDLCCNRSSSQSNHKAMSEDSLDPIQLNRESSLGFSSSRPSSQFSEVLGLGIRLSSLSELFEKGNPSTSVNVSTSHSKEVVDVEMASEEGSVTDEIVDYENDGYDNIETIEVPEETVDDNEVDDDEHSYNSSSGKLPPRRSARSSGVTRRGFRKSTQDTKSKSETRKSGIGNKKSIILRSQSSVQNKQSPDRSSEDNLPSILRVKSSSGDQTNVTRNSYDECSNTTATNSSSNEQINEEKQSNRNLINSEKINNMRSKMSFDSHGSESVNSSSSHHSNNVADKYDSISKNRVLRNSAFDECESVISESSNIRSNRSRNRASRHIEKQNSRLDDSGEHKTADVFMPRLPVANYGSEHESVSTSHIVGDQSNSDVSRYLSYI
jgi:hypothetical protein